MLKNSGPFAALAALAISFLLPAGAVAGTITVFDLTDNLTFSISSDIQSRVTGGLAGGAFCIGETCSFIIAPPIPNPQAQLTPRTNIFGPDGPLSDTFQFLTPSFPSVVAVFASDSETGPALVPFPAPFSPLTEDGTVQQVGVVTYLNPGGIVVETDTMFMQSDATIEGPEPSSVVLMLAGFTVLFMVVIHRRVGSASTRLTDSRRTNGETASTLGPSIDSDGHTDCFCVFHCGLLYASEQEHHTSRPAAAS
jgi:hypothetical protein